MNKINEYERSIQAFREQQQEEKSQFNVIYSFKFLRFFKLSFLFLKNENIKYENELKATIFSKEKENKELMIKIIEYERFVQDTRQKQLDDKFKFNVISFHTINYK